MPGNVIEKAVSSRSGSRAALIRDAAIPLSGSANDYDGLLERVSDAQFVLLGEASHGTHEFYKERAQITKRLIQEKGFSAVAVEADWPDAYQINQFVRGKGMAQSAIESLNGFQRFPQWMWRNADVLDFVGWLRNHNDLKRVDEAKTGFYGLDLYSLYSSLEAVIDYLRRVDPAAAEDARVRYSCFEFFEQDPQRYGYASHKNEAYSCEEEVISQLVDLQKRSGKYLERDNQEAVDAFFDAEQNARLAKNAEQYYRAMFRGRPSTWNLRDEHMVETLESLVHYLDNRNQQKTKVVVWAHNSHLGNARHTQMSERGEINVGQLVKEHHRDKAVLVGFTTYSGTVTAASDWGDGAERKRVQPAMAGSYEALFHDSGLSRFFLNFQDREDVADSLREPPQLERAIGVIYRPDTERYSHYFHAKLPDQFDVVLHFDETRAVEPLDKSSDWVHGEMGDTYPTGL